MKIKSPNNIEVLLHYHTDPRPHPRGDAPAVHDATVMLLALGCIQAADEPGAYRTTEKGQAWVDALCNVEMPREAFIDNEGKILRVKTDAGQSTSAGWTWKKGRTVDDGYCPKMEETIENLNRVESLTEEGRIIFANAAQCTHTESKVKGVLALDEILGKESVAEWAQKNLMPGEWVELRSDGVVVPPAEQPEI